MVKKAGPIMCFIGELRIHGTDWDIPELRNLFQRLGDTLAKAGTVTRYVRYFGESGGRTEVRFFGVQVDSLTYIPEGMAGLELDDDSINVFQPPPGGLAEAWNSALTWNWLDLSAPGFPVGEFKAHVPAGWTSQPESSPINFILATNMYSEKDKVSDDDISLVEYDPRWPAKFEEMAGWLRENIRPQVLLRTEHVGSTAIPGMPAKPVIDILLEVPTYSEARRTLIPVFNKPECECWRYDDHIIIIIRKELMGTRMYHIHAVPAGHDFGKRMIMFRDYLGNHTDDAKRYAALKYELAERNATDREAYTDAKAGFVKEIIAKALKE